MTEERMDLSDGEYGIGVLAADLPAYWRPIVLDRLKRVRDAARTEERGRIIAHLKARHRKTHICECITLAPDPEDFE